ncbi:hypothetical protein [Maricaulis sp.]|uniref:hypothetical protein n=1 Tax=Maricaulis sp. TaxID=1486257 RepID=UPI00260E499B|nr:hypothetical protein [Maricaulis sp.]
MSDTDSTSDPAPRKRAQKPEPGSREDRLADALRANLRRRKSASKKPAPAAGADDSAAAQTGSEKPAKPS